MIAGRLTEFVTLLKPTTTRDGFGAEVVEYTATATVRAEVKWKSGSTSIESDERFPGTRLEVLLHDAHEVAAQWRLIYEGETFYVDAAEHGRQKGYRRLICDRVNE